jgi:predicted RNA-binding Zn-ribbon protein involved in translation (DUF1610 family)
MQGHQAPEHTAHRLSVTQPTWKEHTMRNTQSVPTCPQCGVRVYRTHTCRRSGLTPGSLDRPARVGAPLELVPMPEGWKAQALERGQWDPSWPTLAQLELVTEPELDDHDAWADALAEDLGL